MVLREGVDLGAGLQGKLHAPMGVMLNCTHAAVYENKKIDETINKRHSATLGQL